VGVHALSLIALNAHACFYHCLFLFAGWSADPQHFSRLTNNLRPMLNVSFQDTDIQFGLAGGLNTLLVRHTAYRVHLLVV
jgi:hypothetical protein